MPVDRKHIKGKVNTMDDNTKILQNTNLSLDGKIYSSFNSQLNKKKNKLAEDDITGKMMPIIHDILQKL